MNTTEIFLIAMTIIFTVPWLIWRLGRTDYYAPLVVVQIITGILLGPGILGRAFPDYYGFVFMPAVIQALNGIAWWAVMLFVMIAGIELDLKKAWAHRRESGITAGLALGTPLLFGCGAAVLLLGFDGWMGRQGQTWQFVVGVGMACAVTALPILILLMEKLEILRQPIGQRILRYASLDDIAIWGVLAVILLDWERMGRQLGFLAVFFLSTGLRTNWAMGGAAVFMVAALMLFASVSGKLAGIHIAGKILKWGPGEASIIGWLLQTKALIMIIFANILLDKQIITSETFTALLLMAVASTMLTVPMVAPRLARLQSLILRSA